MAEHSDGSIIIDSEIDTEGFEAGSKKLHKAMTSLSTKFQSLGTVFQKALSGNEKAISSFETKTAALENTISELEEQLQSLGNAKMPTEDYQWFTTEIQKANNELDKLYEREAKMKGTGVKKNSRAWQSLQYDISLAKKKIKDYEDIQSDMRSDGTAFQMGSDTAEYAQLNAQLEAAKNKLADMQTQVEKANGSTSRLAKMGKSVKTAFSKIGSVGKKALSGLVGLAKKAGNGIKNLGKKTTGCVGAINKLGKKITGLGGMLKRLALRQIMMSMITAVKEGFNNLAQYSSQANSDLSALKSGLTQLKNSFATAFAPILTAVTPVLSTLINYLSTAITYVGKFVAALTGAKTFTKATAVQEDYAASLEGTGAAAEKAQRQLAGFDELNVMSESSSGGGGGSAGSASPSEMFEEVPIESSITDFVNKIKEAFRNGDYAGIGKIFGEGINSAVQKLNDYISWDKVGAKITSGIKGTAKFFNSLGDTVDWCLIGDTIAQGLNTALNTLFLVITEFDWPGLAAGLANSLNGLVSGFNWSKLGTTLSTGLTTAIATLRSAISTFDWASLGTGFADGINNIDWVGILSGIAGTLSDLVTGLLDGLIGLAENLDWGKLGRDLWNGIVGIVTNIDWGGIISKAFRLLGAAVGGAATLVWEFCVSLWESLKSGFDSMFTTYFAPYLNEMGKLGIEGFFNGIGDMLSDVGDWIVENIWNPFIQGFKNAFGIHSPSTKMAEMGRYIVEGLLNGIKGVWNTVTAFFSTTFEGIKTTISNAWENVKTGASTAWRNITTTLSTAWEGIKTTASTKWENLKTTISSGWQSIKTTASAKWGEIKTTLSTAWEGLKTTASTKWEGLKTTISSGWNSIKTTASNKWGEIKTTLSTAWEGIKTTASTKWDSIKSTIQNKGWSGVGKNICDGIGNGINSGWKWLKDTVGNVAGSLLDKAKAALGIHSPSKLFRDIVGLNIGYGIGEGIEASEGSVVNSVAGLADAVAAKANAGDYAISPVVSTPEVDNALTGFSDKVANSFSTLLDRLQAIADSVTFTTPAIANGIQPPAVAARVNGVNGNFADTFEASNEELGSVVIQAVTNATTAIVAAIEANSGTTVNLDSYSLASNVIKEINRRTVASGESPFLSLRKR